MLQTPTAAWPLKTPPKCPAFDPPFILPFYGPRSNFFNRLNVGNCGERNTRILWHGKKPVDLNVTFRLWNVLQCKAHILTFSFFILKQQSFQLLYLQKERHGDVNCFHFFPNRIILTTIPFSLLGKKYSPFTSKSNGKYLLSVTVSDVERRQVRLEVYSQVSETLLWVVTDYTI